MSTHQSVTNYNRRRMKAAAAAQASANAPQPSSSPSSSSCIGVASTITTTIASLANSIAPLAHSFTSSPSSSSSPSIQNNNQNINNGNNSNHSHNITPPLTSSLIASANISNIHSSSDNCSPMDGNNAGQSRLSNASPSSPSSPATLLTATLVSSQATVSLSTMTEQVNNIEMNDDSGSHKLPANNVSATSVTQTVSSRSVSSQNSSQNPLNSRQASVVMSPLRSPYNRTRSKSYGGQKGAPEAPDLQQNMESSRILQSLVHSNSPLSNFSFANFQMPHNFSQVLPNLNSLPDYFNSVSIPNMPNISIPTITMPTLANLPQLPNLSMPNISMPSIPSIPNLNIPSISEFMNFPGRKNPKSWTQICRSVKESRERYAEICPSIPFCLHFRYNDVNRNLRIYFLASVKSETTLYYCDVQAEGVNNAMRTIFEIDEEMLLDSDMEHDQQNPNPSQNMQSSFSNFNSNSSGQNHKSLHERISDFDGFEHAPKVPKRNLVNSSSSSSSSSSDMEEDEEIINDNDVQSAVDSVDQNNRNPSLPRPPPVSSPTGSVPDCEDLQWQPLLARQTSNDRSLDDSFDASVNSGSSFSVKSHELSREEDLILERKRMPFTGLISYDFHQEAARFVYTVKNVIYWFDDLEILNRTTELPRYVPQKLTTSNSYSKMCATLCPHNPDFVAYVADNDLWVCNLITGDDIRLTNMSKMKGLSAGQPSFVMQEEFNRFDGFWWRPKGEGNQNDGRFMILCEFLDEKDVPVTAIPNCDGSAELHYFPKPGGRNAISSLAIVSFSYNAISPSKRNLNNSGARQFLPHVYKLSVLEDDFPEFEYLVNASWINSEIIAVQMLDRRQTKIVLGIISVGNHFPPQILFEEQVEKGWYNCHQLFYVYDRNDISKPGDVINFLWSSEETGFRHLYKNSCRIQDFVYKEKYSGEKTPPRKIHEDFLNSYDSSFEKKEKAYLKSELLCKQQITSGQWEVLPDQIWVDETRDLIYFLGNKQSPLECHLYCVSSKFTPRFTPRRVTQEDYTHSNIHFDPLFNYCIDFQSNLTKPPFSFLHRVQAPEGGAQMVTFEPVYNFLSPPDGKMFSASDEFYDKVQSLGPAPGLFECKLESGELIYGFFFKPDIVEPGVKYPVLLEIYGGPEIQVVSKSFKDVRQHKRHLLASEGYVVVGFDSRGSKNRGTEFERHIHRRLGQVEIQDQVEVLQWLAEKTGIIDMSRVAIHGWSYGGYLSLMALVQRPDIFKCCIAGAPVTNWRLYDTAYTERYMGLPDENPYGYKLSSVLTHVRSFPDEHNRLFIFHGLMDENVHYAHTAQLVDALIKAGKPYNLNMFPYERHCLRKSYCSEHYEATLLLYLQQNL